MTSQWDTAAFAPYRAAFPEAVRDARDALVQHCLALAEQDIKDPAWKKLQGLIWRQGYADGVLAVPLFQDVAEVLKTWSGRDKFSLVIFSSGSVEAQKLFFRYVDPDADLDLSATEDAGKETKKVQTEDLNGLFVANFDTLNAGPKIVASSYEKIASELGVDATACLFLSDNVKEVVAAKQAGMQSLIVDRPGNAPLSTQDREENTVITSLADLCVVKRDR